MPPLSERDAASWGASALVLTAVALGTAGCQHDSHARAEAALLRRQIRELRTVVEDDQAGRLFPRDKLAVGVRQELLRDLLQRRLPFEAMPVPTIRVRIETAQVTLEGGQSLVALKGRVEDDTAVFADITLFGGLHLFSVDAKAGIVTARVNVERVDVWRTGAGPTERAVLEGLNEGLRGPALSALSEMLPPMEMPVRLDPVLDFPGVTGAALEVPAQRLAVDVSVARVVPVNGRLWLFFDVSVRS